MKIRKKALRRFIRESIYKNSRQATGRGRRASSIDPLAAVEEMGYDINQHPALDSNNMAIDDALEAYPGEFTYRDIIAAVKAVGGITEAINEVRPHNRGTEGYEMTSQAALDKKMYDTIIDVLPMRGAQGLSGAELVDTVNQDHPEINAEMIYDFLDELLEDGVVNFDVEMDEWTLATR